MEKLNQLKDNRYFVYAASIFFGLCCSLFYFSFLRSVLAPKAYFRLSLLNDINLPLSIILLIVSLAGFYFIVADIETLKNKGLMKPIAACVTAFTILACFSIFLSRTNLINTEKLNDQEIQSRVENFRTLINSRVNSLNRMAKRASKGNYQLESDFISDAKAFRSDFKDIHAIEVLTPKNKVKWIQPQRGNEQFVGKVLFQDKKRKDTLKKAIKSKQPQFSPIVELEQGGEGTLLYAPIFINESHSGHIITVFKMDEIIRYGFGEDFIDGHQIEIKNLEQVQVFGAKDTKLESRYISFHLRDHGLNWRIRVKNDRAIILSSLDLYPDIVLTFGLLISLFIGVFVYFYHLLSMRKIDIEKAYESKSDFLANISHEIRTPLNGVVGITNLLEGELETSENKKRIEYMKASSQILLQLVNDILDFSKIEKGKVVLENNPESLQDLLLDIEDLFKPLVETKKIDLEVDTSDLHGVFFLADKTRLTQIISNLVNNAIKFTEEGYVRISVDVHNQIISKKQKVIFKIEDTGIGISKEAQKKLFSTFSQADASTTRKYGGTGLGLSIAKSFAQLMGGGIQVKSEEGKGSVFEVSVYLEPVEISSKMTEKITNSELEPFAEQLTVLVAEDNEINQIVIKEFLLKLNCEVLLASNGQVAVDICMNQPVDVILMDCQMPVMDGYEATKIITEKMRGVRPLIVALTASTTDETRKACSEAGMDGFLVKPLDHNKAYNLLKASTQINKKKSA